MSSLRGFGAYYVWESLSVDVNIESPVCIQTLLLLARPEHLALLMSCCNLPNEDSAPWRNCVLGPQS